MAKKVVKKQTGGKRKRDDSQKEESSSRGNGSMLLQGNTDLGQHFLRNPEIAKRRVAFIREMIDASIL